MGICAYCREDSALTREHIIPKWFIDIDPSPDDVSYLERAPRKFVPESFIKDVCADCNNKHLSKLDAYGKELYNKYFINSVYAGVSVEFNYDFERLVKWLIKCSYNSARAHNTDLEVLEEYAELLITSQALPKDIVIFISLLAPSKIDAFGTPSAAYGLENNDILEPNWFRLGVFRIPDFDSMDYCFRTVIINSYLFFIVLPKIGEKSSKHKAQLLIEMNSRNVFGQRLPETGLIKLNRPIKDALSSFSGHMFSNPFTYELFDDGISKHVRANGTDTILFLIQRDDIELENFDEIETFLKLVRHSREASLLYMQKIEFTVDGYNDDPRELCEIKEVVRYLGKLNRIFPYWLLYQHNEGKWLNLLLACLAHEKLERPEGKLEISLDMKKVHRHINRWFLSLNELCHEHSISETINRKVSADFIARLEILIPEVASH